MSERQDPFDAARQQSDTAAVFARDLLNHSTDVSAFQALDERTQEWVISYFDFRAFRATAGWLVIPALSFLLLHDSWPGSSAWEWPLTIAVLVALGVRAIPRVSLFRRMGRELRDARGASHPRTHRDRSTKRESS